MNPAIAGFTLFVNQRSATSTLLHAFQMFLFSKVKVHKLMKALKIESAGKLKATNKISCENCL